MRKIVIFIFLIIMFLCIKNNKNEVLIPDLAIRIRVIASSNDLEDQEIKSKVKNEVNNLLFSRLDNINNYKKAKEIISKSIIDVENIVNKYTNEYEVSYGENYFPSKKYKGVKYKEGNYESLVIKLGNAKGHNFWCVLFPPLCMIDEQKLNDVSYGFYVNNLLKKIK